MPSSEEIDDLLCIINLPLPGQNELVNLIRTIANNTNSNLPENDLNELALASGGLSETRVKQVAAKSLAQKNQLKKKTVAKAKKSLAQKNQLKKKTALRESHVVRQLEKQL